METETTVISIRVPVSVAQAIEEQIAPQSIGEYVAEWLAREAGTPRSAPEKAAYAFKSGLVEWVVENYKSDDFPRDVILKAFVFGRSNKRLQRLHDEAIRDDKRKTDRAREGTLHQKCGAAIKRALEAKVDGRSVQLDGSAWIRSYTYLVPGE